jgi:hypothetical protein
MSTSNKIITIKTCLEGIKIILEDMDSTLLDASVVNTADDTEAISIYSAAEIISYYFNQLYPDTDPFINNNKNSLTDVIEPFDLDALLDYVLEYYTENPVDTTFRFITKYLPIGEAGYSYQCTIYVNHELYDLNVISGSLLGVFQAFSINISTGDKKARFRSGGLLFLSMGRYLIEFEAIDPQNNIITKEFELLVVGYFKFQFLPYNEEAIDNYKYGYYISNGKLVPICDITSLNYGIIDSFIIRRNKLFIIPITAILGSRPLIWEVSIVAKTLDSSYNFTDYNLDIRIDDALLLTYDDFSNAEICYIWGIPKNLKNPNDPNHTTNTAYELEIKIRATRMSGNTIVTTLNFDVQNDLRINGLYESTASKYYQDNDVFDSCVLPRIVYGVNWTYQFKADGGVPPYTWDINTELKTHFTIDPNTGVMSGSVTSSSQPSTAYTPTGVTGTKWCPCDVTLTDSEGYTKTIRMYLEFVSSGAMQLQIIDTSNLYLQENFSYSGTQRNAIRPAMNKYGYPNLNLVNSSPTGNYQITGSLPVAFMDNVYNYKWWLLEMIGLSLRDSEYKYTLGPWNLQHLKIDHGITITPEILPTGSVGTLYNEIIILSDAYVSNFPNWTEATIHQIKLIEWQKDILKEYGLMATSVNKSHVRLRGIPTKTFTKQLLFEVRNKYIGDNPYPDIMVSNVIGYVIKELTITN